MIIPVKSSVHIHILGAGDDNDPINMVESFFPGAYEKKTVGMFRVMFEENENKESKEREDVKK